MYLYETSVIIAAVTAAVSLFLFLITASSHLPKLLLHHQAATECCVASLDRARERAPLIESECEQEKERREIDNIKKKNNTTQSIECVRDAAAISIQFQ